MTDYILYSDGGSRGNPGPAGIGFVLKDGYGSACDGGAVIGEATNNVAEYRALIWGLENALEMKAKRVEARADSELLIKQLRGEYKVKNAALKPLFLDALNLSKQFDAVEFVHIPREKNEEADALANEAMDANKEVGNPALSYVAPVSLFDSEPDESADDELDNRVDTSASREATDAAVVATTDKEADGEALTVSTGIYTLTVKDHFDAAHHLYDYPGECRDLHGHTWDIEVSVESTQLCELGMVYDFALLKKDLKAVLLRYDHKYLNEIEPFDKLSPTAENLARVIFEQLSEIVAQDGVKVLEVAVWESPIAKLTYRLA